MLRNARKFVASLVAAALVLLSPGPRAGVAFAQTVRSAPVSGATNSGAYGGASAPVQLPVPPSLVPSALTLAPSLSVGATPAPLAAPSAAPLALSAATPVPSVEPVKPEAPVPSAQIPAKAAPAPLGSSFVYEAHRTLLKAVDKLGGGLQSLRPASDALSELKIAAAADGKAIFSDLDHTLVDTNAKFDNQLAPEMVSAIGAVRAAGKTVDVISDRPESVFKTLESLPVHLRAGMFVAVDSGGRVYRYGADGNQVLVHEAPVMTEAAKATLAKAGAAAMARFSEIKAETLSVEPESWRPYTYTIKLKVGSTWEQVRDAGAIMSQELKRAGSDLVVAAKMAKDPSNAPYLVVSVNTKASASAYIAEQRGLKGKDVVILGDGMYVSPKDGGNANDAAMLNGVPGAKMFSVGGTGDPRRKGLVVLGKSGAQGSLDVLLSVASKPLIVSDYSPESRGRLRTLAHEIGLWLKSYKHYFIDVNVDNWREYVAARSRSAAVQDGTAPVKDARGFFVDSRMMGMIGGARTVGSRSGSDAYVKNEAIGVYDRYFGERGVEARAAFLAFLDRAVAYNPLRSSSNLRKHLRKGLHSASLLSADALTAHFDGLMKPNVNESALAFQKEGAARTLAAFRAAVKDALAGEDASASDRVVGVVMLGSFAMGAATPTSDFDLHVLTNNGASRRIPAFLERLEKRWSSDPDSVGHPINGAEFGFVPSRALLMRIHHDRFAIIAADVDMERALSPPADHFADRSRPDAPTHGERAEWALYNTILRAATRIDDGRIASAGTPVESLDDATRSKALKGWLIGRSLYLIGFILAGVFSYPLLAQALVGVQGYTDLMSLGAVAAILLAPLSGLVADKLSFRNMFGFNGVIRVALALSIPALVAAHVVGFWPLLVVALLNSWNVASSLVAEDKMMPALAGADPKRLSVLNAAANINFIGLSVILGTFLTAGRWADALAAAFGTVNGLSMMFGVSAILAAAGALIQWYTIPNVALAKPAVAAKPENAAEASANRRRNLAIWTGTLGAGGALYLVLHAFVPQFAALALVGAALAGLVGTSKALARLWKNPVLRTGTLLSMAYSFVIYPVGSMLIPFSATNLKGGAMMQGQLQGSLFFGQLLAGSTMLNLPGRWNAVVRGIVLAALGAWLGLYLFPASLAMAAAGMAIAGGLYAVSTRLSDRGWMRYAFIGLSSLALPLAFWGNIPALLLGIMIIGLVNVPNKITIDTVVQREAKADAQHTGELLGLRSALSAIAAAFGYASVGAVASAFSFPAALWPMLGMFAAIGLLLWMAPRWLGNKLSATNFKTDAPIVDASRELSLDEIAAAMAERLKAKGVKAIITDYDGTLMDKVDDKAVVASGELVGLLRRLRELGVNIVVCTNHFFTGDHNGMTNLLGDRLDAKTRAGMLFSVQSGARVYEYGADGSTPAEPAWKEVGFDDGERAKIDPVFAAAAAKIGLKPEDIKVYHEESRSLVELLNHFELEGEFYKALAEANEANGFGYLVQLKATPTMRVNKVPYVQYFKAHKGTGARKAMEMLKAKGLIEDESQVLIFGDDYKPETGNDLYMAKAMPGALAVSVGKTWDKEQPNVLQSEQRGAANIRELIARLNKMLEERASR